MIVLNTTTPVILMLVLGACLSSNPDQRPENSLSNTHYDEQIQIAEAYLFSNNDFAAALKIYDSLFAHARYCFSADLHNAVLCAIAVGDKGRVQRYVNKLLGRDIPDDYFASLDLSNLYSQSEWLSVTSSRHIAATRNHDAWQEWYLLLERDQRFTKEMYTGVYSSAQIRDSTEVRLDVTKKLIDKYGFPSEKLVGTHVLNEDSTDITHYPFYNVIFTHFYQYGYYVLDPMADSLIEAGLMNERVYKAYVKMKPPDSYRDSVIERINAMRMRKLQN